MARRGYPPEFRRRVIDLVEGGRKVAEVAGGRRVSQAYCSAQPIAYSQLPESSWESFARLVLDGATRPRSRPAP
jgi:hypothetical protein